MNAPLKFDSVKPLVSAEEWQARIDLAAAYRLVAMFGWDDLVYTHISARVPGEAEHFLINPYGLFFDEITASSLVKIDEHGTKMLPSAYDVNPAGFVIHSAIHAGRPDVNCVLHTHTLHGVAVSVQAGGLLPLSQHATIALNGLAYHGYEGIALRDEEKPRLVADLGRGNSLILRNHGLLTCGAGVADAFLRMYVLEASCRMQILAQSGGTPLLTVDPGVVELNTAQTREAVPGQRSGLVWPGLLRRLDRRNPGYDA
jgi:ribulose-5-phosphate 4-epimerase/fuculose-1-phosphate aldolase